VGFSVGWFFCAALGSADCDPARIGEMNTRGGTGMPKWSYEEDSEDKGIAQKGVRRLIDVDIPVGKGGM
jgi:hypothetical protein